MNPQRSTVRPNPFVYTQWRALAARHQEDQGFWNPQELARLRFLRWLYRTGRLGVGHHVPAPGLFIAKEVRAQHT